MGNNHKKTDLDHARDELMSHVIRCEVLKARMEDREHWLDETMEYMKDRYPTLNDMQVAQLEMVGRQFIKPVIPHGKGNHAANRPDAVVTTTEGDEVAESDLTHVETTENEVEVELPDEAQDAPDEMDAEPQPA